MNPKQVVRDYMQRAYDDRQYALITWRGHRVLQFTTDLWVYAELLHRVQPHCVVESGSFGGGSALFTADMLSLVDGWAGRILTIDTEDWSGPQGLPEHWAITYMRGSSTDPRVIEQVRAQANGLTCMVVLDSNHHRDHVLSELNAYADLVSVGSYLIVQDTCVHDVMPDYGPGPDDALREWLPEHPEFVVDRACERLLVGQNPGGWLRRVR